NPLVAGDAYGSTPYYSAAKVDAATGVTTNIVTGIVPTVCQKIAVVNSAQAVLSNGTGLYSFNPSAPGATSNIAPVGNTTGYDLLGYYSSVNAFLGTITEAGGDGSYVGRRIVGFANSVPPPPPAPANQSNTMTFPLRQTNSITVNFNGG